MSFMAALGFFFSLSLSPSFTTQLELSCYGGGEAMQTTIRYAVLRGGARTAISPRMDLACLVAGRGGGCDVDIHISMCEMLSHRHLIGS